MSNKFLRFQHSKIIVTESNLKEVRSALTSLLKDVVQLLNENRIRYVLAHGNLLEFTRGSIIIHDDDIDLRFYCNDYTKIGRYLSSLKRGHVGSGSLSRYYSDEEKGLTIIQPTYIKNYSFLKIIREGVQPYRLCCDLVASNYKSLNFKDYGRAFYQPLRFITYNYVDKVAVPSEETTDYLLKKEYGPDYLIPILPSKPDSKGVYQITLDAARSSFKYHPNISEGRSQLTKKTHIKKVTPIKVNNTTLFQKKC